LPLSLDWQVGKPYGHPVSTDRQTTRHVLPGDPDARDADVTWFQRQNAFERDELIHLVGYKRDVLRIAADGTYSKRPGYTYPHILPAGALRHAFYEPLADEILDYLDTHGIQQHTELLNLKSSQAACLNLLFPLRRDLRLATVVLNPFLPKLAAVTGIEFEYTAQNESAGDDGCTRWLGEPPGGKRGQNRTSIDAAVFWLDTQGKQHATLVEWKYTERSFGVCSAFDKAKGQVKQQCLADEFSENCLLTSGGPYRSRKYWSRLAPSGIALSRASPMPGCPFRGPFYQLMRQFLVGRYMIEKELVQHANVVAVHFGRNTALQAVPRHLRPLGASSVVAAWNSLLTVVPDMRLIEAEQLIAAYDAAPVQDDGWREFIRARYRL